MKAIKQIIKKIQKQQDIINAEVAAAELGHIGARAKVVQAEERLEELKEQLKGLTLFVALGTL